MTPHIQALEARLRAYREDGESWWVYGDWLLQQGDPRGELIALERRLYTEPMSREQALALVRQREALERQLRPQWDAGWPPESGVRGWQFGFVTCVSGLRGPDPLRAFDALLAHPCAHLLGFLSMISDDLDDEAATSLAGCEPCPSLVRLDLGFNHIGDRGVAALAASDVLSTVTRLSLNSNQLGARGVLALAHADALSSLTDLDLSFNRLGPEGIQALAQATSLRSLTTLDLTHTGLGDEGVVALAQSTSLPSLTQLTLLESTPFGPEARAALGHLEQRVRWVRSTGDGDIPF